MHDYSNFNKTYAVRSVICWTKTESCSFASVNHHSGFQIKNLDTIEVTTFIFNSMGLLLIIVVFMHSPPFSEAQNNWTN